MKLVLVVALCACSTVSPTTIDAPPPHPDAPADAAIDAPTPRAGIVFLQQGTIMNAASAAAGAGFVEGSPFGTPLGTSGACTAYTTPHTKGLSAGSIAITGTAMPLTLVPSGTATGVTYQASPKAPSPLFAAGASIGVAAPGTADFPAFSATLTGPAALAGFTAPTSISRAAGYTATWTAGSGPGIWVYLIGTSGPAIDLLLCKVPDTGSYAIAPAALALLPSTDTKALVIVGRTAEVELTSPTVTVFAASYLGSGPIPLNP